MKKKINFRFVNHMNMKFNYNPELLHVQNFFSIQLIVMKIWPISVCEFVIEKLVHIFIVKKNPAKKIVTFYRVIFRKLVEI